MTESAIIDHLRQNKYNQAVKGLYDNLPAVRKYILKNHGGREDAKDIFQDALVILYKKVQEPSFTLQSSLSAYFMGIVKNLWRQELRRKNKWPTTGADDSIPAEEMHQTGFDHLALAAFNSLGQKCRELLHLFYYKKLSYKEIVHQGSLHDENTAKNQKYRCLQKAKEYYLTLINK
jgi:RNA polymerase sigma factor (sigma-70 family)